MRKHLYLLFILSVFCIKANVLYAANNFSNANPENIQNGVLTNSSTPSASAVSLSNYAKLAPSTITLSGIPVNFGIAQLNWSTDTTYTSGIYYLERDTSASGLWVGIAQFPYNATLQYSDTITYPYCNPTNFSYRVRFEFTPTGETRISNTVPMVLRDNTQPANVDNLLVSINVVTSPNCPVITWNQVTGDEILKYEVNRYNGFGWSFNTNVPADSNRYSDNSVTDVCFKSYSYAIVTIDRCGLRSTPDYAMRNTLKLVLSSILPCERLAKLSWDPCVGMPGGLGGYQIYRRIGANGTLDPIATLTDTTITNYVDAYQFVNGESYFYSISAYSASGPWISTSCEPGYVFSGSDVPDSVYITQVSVEGDKDIKISFNSEPTGTIKKLILERSIDGGVTFQPIDTIFKQYAFVEKFGSFVDTTVDVHSQSYSYQLKAIDICGTDSIYSNISKSIFFKCDTTLTQNTIYWNGYESWIKDVEGYKVFRTVEGQPAGGELLQSVSSSTLTYPDLATNVDPTKEACYWVVAAENPGNPYLTNAISFSNTCCIIKGATLFMPNAFRPGGINDRFKPVATFVDPQSFKMTIFNRWGQQLFETTDMVNGWDGEINGQFANEGLYAFIVTYKSVGGEDYTKRGTVMVVR